MGCGCGSKKVKVGVNLKNNSLKKACPKCGALMGYKQLYSPKAKSYIKKWECPRCKFKQVSQK